MPKRLNKIISIAISILLLFEQSGFAAGGAIDLSSSFAKLTSGISTSLSSSATNTVFRPIHLRYLEYLPKDNSFKLLLDKGDSQKEANTRHSRASGNPGSSNSTNPSNPITQATQDLMNYFYIGLTLPNDSFWVNLRPDSPDNIIDTYLSKTDIGRILLEADVQLKKDTASYTNPSTPEGKEYWNKLYKKAEELFGTDQIAIPTLTRPWIVPGEIIIRETGDSLIHSSGSLTINNQESNQPSAYIYKATLKVMLEEDYLKNPQSIVNSPQNYSFTDPRLKELNSYSTTLIKELIIPKLTKEVNSSKRYASLRQVYYSLILAQWFKARYKPTANSPQIIDTSLRALEGRSNLDSNVTNLIDKKNLTNLASKTPWNKSTYFNQYQQSFTKGEYNTKETVYTPSGQVVRSYMSGGIKIMPEGIISSGSPLNKTTNPIIAITGSSPIPETANNIVIKVSSSVLSPTTLRMNGSIGLNNPITQTTKLKTINQRLTSKISSSTVRVNRRFFLRACALSVLSFVADPIKAMADPKDVLRLLLDEIKKSPEIFVLGETYSVKSIGDIEALDLGDSKAIATCIRIMDGRNQYPSLWRSRALHKWRTFKVSRLSAGGEAQVYFYLDFVHSAIKNTLENYGNDRAYGEYLSQCLAELDFWVNDHLSVLTTIGQVAVNEQRKYSPFLKQQAEGIVSKNVDHIARYLRARHDEGVLSGEVVIKKELFKFTGENSYLISKVFVSNEMFRDLASIIFDYLQQQAKVSGKSLFKFLQTLDSGQDYLDKFLFQAANFNKLNAFFENESILNEVLDRLFKESSQNMLKANVSRLTLFVQKTLKTRDFIYQQKFQLKLLEYACNTNLPAINRFFVGCLLELCRQDFTYINTKLIDFAVKDNKVPLEILYQDRINLSEIFKASNILTAKVIFADKDALNYFDALVELFIGKDKRYTSLGGYSIESRDNEQVVLRKKNKRVVLIKDIRGNYNLNNDIGNLKAQIIMSRGHSGTETRIFVDQLEPKPTSQIFFPSECRSATGISRIKYNYPGARVIGIDDIAYGDRSNIVLYYLMDELAVGKTNSWSQLKQSISMHLATVDGFVFPGEASEVVAEALRLFEAKNASASSAVSFDQVKDLVLNGYNIGAVQKIELSEDGFVGKPFIVTTDTGKYVLKEDKLGSPFDDAGLPQEERIRRQAFITEYLRQHGFPEMPLIRYTGQGSPSLEYEGRRYILYDFVEGETNRTSDTRLFEFIANYHNAIRNLPNPESLIVFNSKLERIGKRLKYLQAAYAAIRAKSGNALSEFEKLILDWFPIIANYTATIQKNISLGIYDSLPKLMIHGDYYDWNVVSREGVPVGLIDPQFTYDTRICDLAKFRFSDEINENLIINRLLTYQNYIKDKLTAEELNFLKDIFIIESLDDFIFYYEMYQRQLQGGNIPWLTVSLEKSVLNRVNKLIDLNWDGIIRAVASSAVTSNQQLDQLAQDVAKELLRIRPNMRNVLRGEAIIVQGKTKTSLETVTREVAAKNGTEASLIENINWQEFAKLVWRQAILGKDALKEKIEKHMDWQDAFMMFIPKVKGFKGLSQTVRKSDLDAALERARNKSPSLLIDEIIDGARRIMYYSFRPVFFSENDPGLQDNLNEYVELPAQKLVRRILANGGTPFASNAFGTDLKGVWWQKDGIEYFSELNLEDYDFKELENEPLRQRLQTGSSAINQASENAVKNSFLKKELIDYWQMFAKIINPQAKDLVVAAGASGADVSGVLFATNFKKAYFIDNLQVTREKLIAEHESWGKLELLRSCLTTKFSKGFTDITELERYGIESLIMLELEALGVRQEDVACVLDERERPKLTFRLPGEEKTREITFVKQNLREENLQLNDELGGKIDVYFERASFGLPYFYDVITKSAKTWLKDNGFILIDSHTTYDENISMRQFDGFGLKEVIVEEIRAKAAYVLNKIMRYKYGWKFSLWQKKEEVVNKAEHKYIGGIDFRSLPIVTQAASNLGLSTMSQELRIKLMNFNLRSELNEIEKLTNAGITPSTERIKEYVQANSISAINSPEDTRKLLSCIADILRKQEEECCTTDPTLKDILVVLESGLS